MNSSWGQRNYFNMFFEGIYVYIVQWLLCMHYLHTMNIEFNKYCNDNIEITTAHN